MQLGDVTSNFILQVTSNPAGASISNTTVANSGLGSAENAAVNYQATQEQGGANIANTNLSFAGSAGSQLYVQTSATGNTGTGGTGSGSALTGSTSQTVDANQTVTAQNNVYIGGPAVTGLVSIDSSAVGNTQGWQTNGGSVAAASTQTQYGETYAALGANVASVSGSASYSATAVGNNITSDATAAPVSLTVSQSADGFRTRAGMDVTQQSGSDITAASTATSNNINVASDSYAANLTSTQFNTNPTQAEVALTAGFWSGTVTASAYSVANSALVSNAGPSTAVDGSQTSTGEVSAVANFNGGSGADATVMSTAVGNAYSAYACPDCNGAVNATLRQTSSGGVSSTTSVTTSSSGYISGAAAAVGNTATFQVVKK